MTAAFRAVPLRRSLCSPLLVALSCALPAVSGLSAVETPRLEMPVELHLPAQALSDSLGAVAQAASLQLVYAPELVAGRQAPALTGTMDARQALTRLLAGSGLVYAATGDRAIAIQPTASTEPQTTTTPGEQITVVGKNNEAGVVDYKPETTATAGFGNQSVLDTPFSVGVIGAEFIRDHQTQSLNEVYKYEPSATSNYYSGTYNNVQVRGSQPTTLLDGTPYWGRAKADLANIEQVEFLKGPAALRGGFGGPGGAMNLVTKRALAHDQTTVGVQGDTWGGYGASVDSSNALLADRSWGTRLNVSADRLDNQWNLKGRQFFASLANDIRLTDATTLTVDVDYLDFSHTYTGEYNVNDDSSLWHANPRVLYGQPWDDQKLHAYTGRIGLRHRFNADWTSQVQVAVYRYNEVWVSSYMNPIQPDGTYAVDWTAYNGNLAERIGLNTTGSVNGALATGTVMHNLTFAVQHSFFRDHSGFDNGGTIGNSNIHDPVVLPEPANVFAARDFSWQSEDHLVATDEAHLNARWSLLFGGRFSHYHSQADDYSATALVPVGAVIFKPTPASTTYVSYAESLEPGAIADSTANNAGEQMPARKSKQVELGGKAEVFDSSLLLTASLYRTRADAYGYVDTNNDYVQSGYQDITGGEIGFSGRVTDRLRITGGGMLLRDTLREINDPVQEGRQQAGTPYGKATLTGDYELPWVEGLAVNGGGFYTGKSHYYTWLGTLVEIPAYFTAEAGLRYAFRANGVPLTSRVLMTNVFNKQAWNENLFPIEPATGKLSLEATF